MLSGCPQCHLWIESNHWRSVVLCWAIWLWPLFCLLWLSYALVLGHWPTLNDFIWSRPVKCMITGSVRKRRTRQTLYHTGSSLWGNKEEIPPRFTNQEQLCFCWKTDLISHYGPCESVTDLAVLRRGRVRGPHGPLFGDAPRNASLLSSSNPRCGYFPLVRIPRTFCIETFF